MSSLPTTKILWTAFGFMTASTVAQWVLTTRQQTNNKLLYHISLTVSTLNLITYYFVLTDINITGGAIWVRNFDWTLTLPMILLELGLISGISIQDLIVLALNGLGMTVTGFLGTIDRTNPLRWPLLVMAWILWVSIVRELLTTGRRSAGRNSSRVGRFYDWLSGSLVVLGTMYPIIWSLRPDPFLEISLFAFLDLLTRSLFGTALLIGASLIPEANVIGSGRYTEAQIWNGIGGTEDEADIA